MQESRQICQSLWSTVAASLAGSSGSRSQPETATHESRLNGSERVVWAVPSRLDHMIFELAQRGKLLVQGADRFWIAQRVAAPQAAAVNRCIECRAKDDVMKRLLQSSEWVNEPRPHDSVHNDEITPFGISFGWLRKDSHNHFVLVKGFGKVGWNCSFPDEMPKVVRMKMNRRSTGGSNQASGSGAFSRAW